MHLEYLAGHGPGGYGIAASIKNLSNFDGFFFCIFSLRCLLIVEVTVHWNQFTYYDIIPNVLSVYIIFVCHLPAPLSFAEIINVSAVW